MKSWVSRKSESSYHCGGHDGEFRRRDAVGHAVSSIDQRAHASETDREIEWEGNSEKPRAIERDSEAHRGGEVVVPRPTPPTISRNPACPLLSATKRIRPPQTTFSFSYSLSFNRTQKHNLSLIELRNYNYRTNFDCYDHFIFH